MKTRLPFFLGILLMVSCSTSKQYRSIGYTDHQPGRYDVAVLTGGVPAQMGDVDKSVSQTFSDGQMIVYNASMDITVRNIDTANKQIVAIAKKHEGYVVSVSNYRTSVRVKSDQLEAAMTELAKIGKVSARNVYGRDISNEYANLTVRKDNAYKARARYLELLAKAEDVKAALEVEKELERLNTEIDLLEMQLSNMNLQVEYSLIDVDLKERTQPGILGYVFIGLYKGVKWLFVWH